MNMSTNDKIDLKELINCIDRELKNSRDQSISYITPLHSLEEGIIYFVKEHYEGLGFSFDVLAETSDLLKITLNNGDPG